MCRRLMRIVYLQSYSMHYKYLIAFLALLLPVLQCHGREQEKRVYADAGVAAGFSHTGYHLSLLIPVHYGKHTVYAGPKILPAESYLPSRNVWGVHAGYTYDMLRQHRWLTDAGIDYQCSFYKPYHFSGNNNPYNRVQELYLMLGLAYCFRPEGRISIKLQLGSGLYADTWYDLSEGGSRTAFGRASAGRFTVSYKIF